MKRNGNGLFNDSGHARLRLAAAVARMMMARLNLAVGALSAAMFHPCI
jgi:hypothetical protein